MAVRSLGDAYKVAVEGCIAKQEETTPAAGVYLPGLPEELGPWRRVLEGQSRLDIALRLAELGLSVIPLYPYRKGVPKALPDGSENPAYKMPKRCCIPKAEGGWKPYQEEKATPEEIRGWWEKYPGCNFAIVCGVVSGTVAVDCDDMEAVQFALKHFPAPVAIVKTGRDEGGYHLYYRHPGKGADWLKKLGDFRKYNVDLEVRADGHYDVAPGSIHPTGREYEAYIRRDGWQSRPEFVAIDLPQDAPTPPNLASPLLDQPAPAVEAGLPVGEKPRDPEAYIRKVFSEDLPKIAGLAEGERNTGLNRLAFNLYRRIVLNNLLPREEVDARILEACSHMAKPLPAEEVATVLASAWRGVNSPNVEPGKINQPRNQGEHPTEDAPNAENIDTVMDMPALTMLAEPIRSCIADVARVNSNGAPVGFGAFLALMATEIEGKVKSSPFPGKEQGMNLYLMLEARSGAGKSPTMEFFLQNVIEAVRASDARYQEEKRQYEADLKRFSKMKGVDAQGEPMDQPVPPHKTKTDVIPGDFTFEGLVRRCSENPTGVAVIVDEIDTLFQSLDKHLAAGKGSPSKSFLLTAYDGGIYSNARKDEENELSANTCRLTIFGSMQPVKLPHLFTLEELYSGFVGRFVFIPYERTEPKTMPTKTYAPESIKVVKAISTYCQNMFPIQLDPNTGQPIGKIIPFEAEAIAAFKEKYETEQRDAFSADAETGLVDKLSVQMTKIITLIHIANAAILSPTLLPGPITREEVEAALPLWEWLKSAQTSVAKRLAAAAVKKKLPRVTTFSMHILAAIIRGVGEIPQGTTRTLTSDELAGFTEAAGLTASPRAVCKVLASFLAKTEVVQLDAHTKKKGYVLTPSRFQVLKTLIVD